MAVKNMQSASVKSRWNFISIACVYSHNTVCDMNGLKSIGAYFDIPLFKLCSSEQLEIIVLTIYFTLVMINEWHNAKLIPH